MRHYAIIRVINQWLVKIVSVRAFHEDRSAVEWARRNHVDGQRLQLISTPQPIAIPVGKAVRRPAGWDVMR